MSKSWSRWTSLVTKAKNLWLQDEKYQDKDLRVLKRKDGSYKRV